MSLELRCESSIKHGELDGDVIEFKCRRCAKKLQPGTVVIHRFSVTSGELLQTKQFKDPAHRKEVNTNG